MSLPISITFQNLYEPRPPLGLPKMSEALGQNGRLLGIGGAQKLEGLRIKNYPLYIIHLKQRYPFSKTQLTKSKTKNIKNSNPINLIFQGVVLEGA